MLCPDVPILNSNTDSVSRLKYLEMLKSSNADRVWIALDRASFFERGTTIETLSDNLRFFEQNGIETGVWIQAYGFGEPMPPNVKRDWTRLRSIEGVSNEVDAFCPEDSGFVSAYLDWVKDIAGTGTKLIMLDDDLCMSVRPGIGCFCQRHIKLLEQKTGKLPVLTDIFTGGKNKYRDAFYEVMGDSNRKFCKKVREAVDSVDPSIRVGLCAGYTSWDIEGTDPIEMSRILAGNTEPFFRLTGAPYWVATKRLRFHGQKLQSVIENARNQISWCKDADVEIFAEADSYPRPCYNVPASLIENFDIAMHVSGVKSLKYMIDYYSSPEYELQYLKIHKRNLPFYEQIEKAFENTVPCGIRLYRPMHRITDAIFPKEFAGQKKIMSSYFSKAAAMLSYLGIPISYDGREEGAAVFGDDALFFEDDHKKVLVDLPSALILQSRGFDVGIKSVSDGKTPSFEIFQNERVLLTFTDNTAGFKNLELKENAKIISRFENGETASFEYGKFHILNFDAVAVGEDSALFCSYSRAQTLRNFFDNPYPAIAGFSDVYSICARKNGGHTVLFQNLSPDPIFDFDIELPKRCKEFKLYRAEGELQGDKIHISTEFSPSASILLEIEYAD